MRTVWKYEVPADGHLHAIALPGADARFVRVGYQGPVDVVTVWALVEPEAQRGVRHLRVYGTGEPVPDGAAYVGTAQAPLGLVWHLFDVTDVAR